MTTATKTRHDIAARFGLSVDAVFVPFSRRPNADGWRSLNWLVTVFHNEREVLNTAYSQGVGHAPAHRLGKKTFGADLDDAVASELETGRCSKPSASAGFIVTRHAVPPPSADDVLYSLVSDADVLEYSRYEDWAPEAGLDPDSRKGEAVYRECLRHSLALRHALGDIRLGELREAFIDY